MVRTHRGKLPRSARASPFSLPYERRYRLRRVAHSKVFDCFFSLIDRRGFVVADPPAPSVVVHKSAESNAVNKVWHESYGSTTVTQPQVKISTLNKIY